MRLALQQAKINNGNTKENPSVGCVIVKNNLVLAASCTSAGGRPHAEENAINSIKRNKENLQLYVTLEPCSHFGKTPPCVNIISKKKIKKVFFSIKDFDIRSYNQSIQNLKNKGVKAKSGILSKEINYFYRSYNKSRKSLFPFVTLKTALSKDFYSVNTKKKWITNEFSRGRVHLMRSVHDCVLTSSQTVLKDDPLLTCRIMGLNKRNPSRIIIDKNLNTPLNSKIVQTAHNIETIIFYNKINIKKLKLLKKNKVKTFKITLNDNGELNLNESLLLAKKLGYYKILVEVGEKLSRSFLTHKLVDDLKIFISNTKINKNGKNNFKNILNKFLKDKKKVVDKVNLLGDTLISYKIK
jgi:diaminohydroxyphosphoribosylaminopyrimidine deaminase/5-amino-6-(5-phosphoribosylamino)uracil reductase